MKTLVYGIDYETRTCPKCLGAYTYLYEEEDISKCDPCQQKEQIVEAINRLRINYDDAVIELITTLADSLNRITQGLEVYDSMDEAHEALNILKEWGR